MLSQLVVLALPLLAALVRAAPAGLDATTLLHNAQEAQHLNSLYDTLSSTDSCTNGHKACVDNMPALCQNGNWSVSNTGCPDQQYCFALPSVRTEGTIVACASEASAESIFSACGVNGGIDASYPSDNTVSTAVPSTTPVLPSTYASAGHSSVHPSATHSSKHSSSLSILSNGPSASVSTSVSVATTTVTLNPTGTATLPPTTLTLAPAEASSLIASLSAAGAQISLPPAHGQQRVHAAV